MADTYESINHVTFSTFKTLLFYLQMKKIKTPVHLSEIDRLPKTLVFFYIMLIEVRMTTV